MTIHSIEKILPFTEQQLYDLVADIESYPKFIPWCEGARILEKRGDVVLADLIIHFKGVNGKYTSRVIFDKNQYEISVELAQGPFHHLYQGWKFTKKPQGTLVEFDIDFKLRSFVLDKIMNMVFDDACMQMMDAFEKRAGELYGRGGTYDLG